MYASKLCIGNLDLTRVLLNYDPCPGIDETDLEEGNTPLHWAIVGGVMSPYALSPLIKVTLRCRPSCVRTCLSCVALRCVWLVSERVFEVGGACCNGRLRVMCRAAL